MKKSLLGLLVIALTVVGCQNYDDQFDDLNNKISTLASQVGELSGLSAAIQAVSDKVTALEGSSASASDLAEVMADVAELGASLDAIQAATDYSTDETDSLEAEIDEIRDAVNELLKQASVIQQDIVITSAAQLEYVENLMGLDSSADNSFVPGESREYILSGMLTVNTTFTSTDTTMLDRVNAVVDRIASVVMDAGEVVTLTVAADQTLTVATLEFIQGGLKITGAGTAGLAALSALTETLTLSTGGIVKYDTLNQVGDVMISATSTITELDFSSVATGGTIMTGAGVLNIAALEGDVNLGGLGLPASVTVNNIDTLVAGAVESGVTLSATNATSIRLHAATPFTANGNITITAKGNIDVNVETASGTLDVTSTEGAIALNSLEEIKGAATLTASETIHLNALTSNANNIVATGSQFHVPALASNAGTLSATASAFDFTALASNDGGIVLNTATSVEMPALATSSATIVANDATTFMAIVLSTATGTINVKAGATIGVGNLATPTHLVDFANLLELQLHAQEASIDFSTAVSMTTLTVLGKKNTPIVQDGQVNDVIITNANAALDDLTVGGVLRQVSLDNTTLETFESVAGSTILDLVLSNNTKLEDVTLAHDRLDGERALAITVNNNDKLETVDMSSVNKIKHIVITGNASLTSITMAGYSPAVEPTAQITVTISANALPGEYTSATAGTDTTPYLEAAILDDTGIICAVKDFVEYYTDAATTGTVTASVDLDDVDLYTQEEDANDVVVRSIADPAVNQALSAHIAADANATGFGGASNAIDSPADFALIDCD